jgi:hypothetical protein
MRYGVDGVGAKQVNGDEARRVVGRGSLNVRGISLGGSMKRCGSVSRKNGGVWTRQEKRDM